MKAELRVAGLLGLLVGALLPAGCPSGVGPRKEAGADWHGVPDLGRTDRLADRGRRRVGASCKPTSAIVVYKDPFDRAPWMPRIAWSNGQYGIVWTQAVTVSSLVLYHAAFARVSQDGKLQGAARMITANPTVGSGAAPDVAITSLGDGFALVWADTRGGTGPSGPSDLYLGQLDAAGDPLDSGKPCTTAGCGQKKITSSQAASSPSLYRPSWVEVEETQPASFFGVAWRDRRSLEEIPYPPYSKGRADIFFKVVNPDGSERSAERRVTTDNSTPKPDWPVIAFDGSNYGVVWRDLSTASSVSLFFTYVNGLGTGLRAEELLAVNQGLMGSPPDLAWAGESYGISFSANPTLDKGQVKFARINTKGEILAQRKVNEEGGPCTPALSFNGERFGIVWQDQCGKPGSRLVFALIDDSGSPVQPDGKSCLGSTDPRCGIIPVSPVEPDWTSAYPNMISVDGVFAVTWMLKKSVYFARIVCTP